MGRPWSEERIRRELTRSCPATTHGRSYPRFRAAGRRELWEAIAARGGPAVWAEEHGLLYTPKRHAWSEGEVRERLRAALRGSEGAVWPSQRWLAARGGTRLVSAMNRTGGATRWARELGIPRRRPEPWTPERSEQALGPLLEGRRTWPSRREFEQAGVGGLYVAIRQGQRHPALAACYDLALQRPGRHRPPARAHPRRASSDAT